MKLNKHDVVVQAVKRLKKSDFGVTAIKVELEAQFGREEGHDACGYCDEGVVLCYGECSSGWTTCDTCDGTGNVLIDEQVVNGTSNIQDCGYCDGTGDIRCEYNCNDGYETCGECDGDYGGYDSGEWVSCSNCQQFILRKLAEHGLAEAVDGVYHTKAPLVFARFYNDGSVDSEFTFTLSLENEQTIFLLPKVVEAFNELGAEITDSPDYDGAGMHMALIRDPGGWYGSRDNYEEHAEHYRNFQTSMTLLMPALYFLGASNENTRGMGYRKPGVGTDKYRAIAYRWDTLEFRVFDVCYDQPEKILDNVVVMSKCMRYWSSQFVSPGVEKVTRQVRFGSDYGEHTLSRLYCTAEHIDLLNRGLERLKPSYYTIKELKQQRQFKVNKHQVNYALANRTKQAEVEYKEYEERFKWQLRINEHAAVAQRMENLTLRRLNTPLVTLDEAEVLAQVEREAAEDTKRLAAQKKSLTNYVQEILESFKANQQGEYTLNVEGRIA